MDPRIKIGIVGVGGHGRTIRNAIRKSGRFEVVSCYDPNEAALKEAAAEFGCEAAVSDEAVFTHSEITAVAIVSPNHLHRRQAEFAAVQGKHIFLEKPIAGTVEDGEAIVKAARKAGVILEVGHHFRKFPSFRFAKEIIESGKLGQIIAVEGNFSAPSGLNEKVPAWKTQKTSCPVVPLMQLGIHGLDTLYYLLGPIVEGFSYQRHARMKGDTLDSSVSLLKFQDNVFGTFSSHYVVQQAFYIHILGTEYNLFVDFKKAVLIRVSDGRDERLQYTFTKPDDEPYLQEIQEFADCISKNHEPEVPGEMGLKNLIVLEALIQSGEQGKSIYIPRLYPQYFSKQEI